MPSQKRQRQDEGRLARLEAERAAQQAAQRRKNLKWLLGILGAVVLAALAISVFSGGGDDDDDVATEDTTTTTTAADGEDGEDTPTPVEVILPGQGASITGETPCPPADGSAARTTSFEQAPPMCIDTAKTYTATLHTTEGDIVIELDDEAAPQTVNNFVVLARYHYYDNVPFHRIIPGFMIQGGDAVGPIPGTGGPGYTFADELPIGDDPYPTGTIAMANSGPDTNGSQFFITVEGGGARLSPDYTAFGRVVAGQDVVDAINQHGMQTDTSDGAPTKAIAITSVEITEA